MLSLNMQFLLLCMCVFVVITSNSFHYFSICTHVLSHRTLLFSIDAVGVDIAPFSAMSGEEEVLLLPGLPLVNLPGENPETDLWTFEVKTPAHSSVATEDSPSVMIDYVHPGKSALSCYQGVW